MPLVLLVPLTVLVAAAVGASWTAGSLRRQLAALRAEVAALARLHAAHDLLVLDIEHTRHRLGGPAEAWPTTADR